MNTKTLFTPAAVAVANQSDPSGIPIRRTIRLGTDLEPGHYYLQLVIADHATGKKPLQTVQWIDFQLVN